MGKPRIFKSKWFERFARKERIKDTALLKAVDRADLGGVIKQRIARAGQGKSGGYRTIILFRRGDKAFFVYGFAKSTLDNIDASDERDFKELAKVLLSASDQQLKTLVGQGKYVEVNCDEEEKNL